MPRASGRATSSLLFLSYQVTPIALKNRAIAYLVVAPILSQRGPRMCGMCCGVVQGKEVLGRGNLHRAHASWTELNVLGCCCQNT